MLYHCFASFKQSLLDFFKLLDSRPILIGVDLTGILEGCMAVLTTKVLLWGKKHIFLHCNASNLVLKIWQHDKIWGTIRRSKFWGDLSPPPVIYAHAHTYAIVWLYKSYNQWDSPMTSGLLDDRSEKVKLRCLDYDAYKCVSALFCWKTKLLSAMCLVAINI